MRIVCPNCEAEYEVPDTAIPAAGRAVECGLCGHGWHVAAPVAAADPEPDPQPEPLTEPPPEEAALPPSRRLDPAMRDLLLAEAAREAEARRAEGWRAEAAAVPPAEAEDAALARGGLRKRLPDVDEIDAALAPEPPAPAAPVAEEVPAAAAGGGMGRGFAIGFVGVLLLAGLALGLYLLAGRMEAPPPALTAYAEAVEAARRALQALLGG